MSTPRAADLPELPEGLGEELRQARREAVDALLWAEKQEADARRERRKATRLLRHYERLLEEHVNHTIDEIED